MTHRIQYCIETDDYEIGDEYGESMISLKEVRKLIKVVLETHPEIINPEKTRPCKDCPILTGEDAIRFHEYINNPDKSLTPECTKLIRDAYKYAMESKK